MRHTAAACLLVLAACGARELPAPEGVASNDPRVVECRREALSAPTVRAIRRAMPPPTDGDGFARAREEAEGAERVVFTDCLVRLGVVSAPPGGVERVRALSFDRQPRGDAGVALPQAPRPSPVGY